MVELSLPADPSSVGRARRATTTVLEEVGAATGVIDAAALLVSEVVTNAVLHAGTDLDLACTATETGALVRVGDRSPVQPAVRHHGDQATTGRGLMLVDAIATSHGVETSPDKKVVWFVVGNYSEDLPSDEGTGPGDGSFDVAFLGVHVEFVRSTLAYGEAVLRELALLAVHDATAEGTTDWHAPQFSLAPLLDALDAASADGAETADLRVWFPADAGQRSLDRLALVDEGDQLAREGRLLTVAAVPEVAYCRRWVYRQITAQSAGAEPEPWVPPDLLPPVISAVSLSSQDIAALDGPEAVIVADEGNRIVFVNDAAVELVGMPSDQLVGQRLTVIVPAEQRLAHLAGFARYQATGEHRLLGTSVAVPLLRADQSIISVDLHLETRLTESGGRVFRGVLRRGA